jgi:hypothetical protein
MAPKKQKIKIEITIEEFERDLMKINPVATKAEIKKAYEMRDKK